jgi:hypothetical protein
MCRGKCCAVRNECYRYRAIPTPGRQCWFAVTPGNDADCEYFGDLKGSSESELMPRDEDQDAYYIESLREDGFTEAEIKRAMGKAMRLDDVAEGGIPLGDIHKLYEDEDPTGKVSIGAVHWSEIPGAIKEQSPEVRKLIAEAIEDDPGELGEPTEEAYGYQVPDGLAD